MLDLMEFLPNENGELACIVEDVEYIVDREDFSERTKLMCEYISCHFPEKLPNLLEYLVDNDCIKMFNETLTKEQLKGELHCPQIFVFPDGGMISWIWEASIKRGVCVEFNGELDEFVSVLIS